MIRFYEIGVLFILKYLVKIMVFVIKLLGNLIFYLNIMIEENEKYYFGYLLQDDDN